VLETDHLIYAVPDLDRALDELHARLGARAAVGGRHPGEGTRNALLSLGPACYLEILAPDPGQPPPGRPLWLGLEGLSGPRLIAWAVRARDLDRIVRRARSSGVSLGEAIEGSRRRADGVLLTWRFTDPHAVVAEGLVPFLIDWGGSPHSAASAPGGVSLLALRGEHPDPAGVARMLDVLGVDLPIARAPRPALIASLQTRSGRVELS
jgi:hypothetical protein